MGEIGMVYAPPEDSRLFGVTVKDSTTSNFTLNLYKCTVRDWRCEVSQPVAPTRVAQLIIGSREVWHR